MVFREFLKNILAIFFELRMEINFVDIFWKSSYTSIHIKMIGKI